MNKNIDKSVYFLLPVRFYMIKRMLRFYGCFRTLNLLGVQMYESLFEGLKF